jgi:hypothetical protein
VHLPERSHSRELSPKLGGVEYRVGGSCQSLLPRELGPLRSRRVPCELLPSTRAPCSPRPPAVALYRSQALGLTLRGHRAMRRSRRSLARGSSRQMHAPGCFPTAPRSPPPLVRARGLKRSRP